MYFTLVATIENEEDYISSYTILLNLNLICFYIHFKGICNKFPNTVI